MDKDLKEVLQEPWDMPSDKPVPYVVFESSQTRLDKIIKRLTIALIVAVVMLFLTNLAWLIAFNQYEYVSDETSIITKDGATNFIGKDGTINAGD